MQRFLLHGPVAARGQSWTDLVSPLILRMRMLEEHLRITRSVFGSLMAHRKLAAATPPTTAADRRGRGETGRTQTLPTGHDSSCIVLAPSESQAINVAQRDHRGDGPRRDPAAACRLETSVLRRAHRMHSGVPSKAKSWPTRQT
jgi:hypothetical protein